MRAGRVGFPSALLLLVITAHAAILALLVVTSWNAGSYLPGDRAVPFVLTQAQLIAAWLVFSRRPKIVAWTLAVAGEAILWAAMVAILNKPAGQRAVAQSIAIQFTVVVVGLGLAKMGGARLQTPDQPSQPEPGRQFQFSIGQILLWTAAAGAVIAIAGSGTSGRGGLSPRDALLLALPAVLSVMTVRATLSTARIAWVLQLAMILVLQITAVACIVDPALARYQNGGGAWIYFLCLVEQQTVTLPTLLAVRACGYRVLPWGKAFEDSLGLVPNSDEVVQPEHND